MRDGGKFNEEALLAKDPGSVHLLIAHDGVLTLHDVVVVTSDVGQRVLASGGAMLFGQCAAMLGCPLKTMKALHVEQVTVICDEPNNYLVKLLRVDESTWMTYDVLAQKAQQYWKEACSGPSRAVYVAMATTSSELTSTEHGVYAGQMTFADGSVDRGADVKHHAKRMKKPTTFRHHPEVHGQIRQTMVVVRANPGDQPVRSGCVCDIWVRNVFTRCAC